jgi:hypothetical protein
MPPLCLSWIWQKWKERGNSAKGWADKMIGTRWKFTDEQTELIYELLGEIE